MYCDFDSIKKTLVTKDGKSTATIPTFKGDVIFTWYDQHAKAVYKDDTKLRGSGCAEIATLCAAMTFSESYGKMTPYDFRHKKQNKMLGHMNMPWTPKECATVIKNAGLRTEYYNHTSLAETYKLLKEHLSIGMPAVVWVYYKTRDGKVDKKYTQYAHVICLAGLTKKDEAIILDSSVHGPLWKADLKDVCNHILPGDWLHGVILVHPDILYRVRRYWSDAASQVGAYARLENAKAKIEELHKMGETYTIYDPNGNPVWPVYRVRKDPDDWETQRGAFVYFRNAVAECELHPGYRVVNIWNEVLMTATDDVRIPPVKVKIDGGAAIFDDPGKMIVARVDNDGIYTIVEIKEHDGSYYGRLRSGAGWVNLEEVRANL